MARTSAEPDRNKAISPAGARRSYAGRPGMAQETPLADLLRVDGDPIAHPAKDFVVIMKVGKNHQNRGH